MRRSTMMERTHERGNTEERSKPKDLTIHARKARLHILLNSQERVFIQGYK